MRISLLIILASIGLSFAKVKVKKPNWEGSWICYSLIHEGWLKGSLQIKKKSGKRYLWKYHYRNDQNLFVDPVCRPIIMEGEAIYDGANTLNSVTRGIKFVYVPEDDGISVYQNFSDEELIQLSLCFGGEFVRKN